MRQMLSTRVLLLACGSACITVMSPIESGIFTIAVNPKQFDALDPHIGSEFDVVAIVERASDGKIVRAHLETFEPVINADPRPAWKAWFTHDVYTQGAA